MTLKEALTSLSNSIKTYVDAKFLSKDSVDDDTIKIVDGKLTASSGGVVEILANEDLELAYSISEILEMLTAGKVLTIMSYPVVSYWPTEGIDLTFVMDNPSDAASLFRLSYDADGNMTDMAQVPLAAEEYIFGDGLTYDDKYKAVSVSSTIARKSDIKEYTAGEGIAISGTELSVDDTIAKKDDIVNNFMSKPTLLGTVGQILTVSGYGTYRWEDLPSSLPESTSADADKVLTVGADGEAVWAEAQGGGTASDITFDKEATYEEGTVGYELQKLSEYLDGLDDLVGDGGLTAVLGGSF